MAEYNLAVIPGDGVGVEVIAEGRKVLEALSGESSGASFHFSEFPWGSSYYRETGRLMPEDGLEVLKGSMLSCSARWAIRRYPITSRSTACCCPCGGASTKGSASGPPTCIPE